MKIENVDVREFIQTTREEINLDSSISSSLKSSLNKLTVITIALVDRLAINSGNSSKPPSLDPNRIRKTRMDKGVKRTKKKAGGQVGHKGNTLKKIENIDNFEHTSEEILIDRSSIPKGVYKRIGFEIRQVFDLKVSIFIREYKAEILQGKTGKEYVAVFPKEVTKAAQYGNGVKSQSVYMSQFQLIPLARVCDFFNHQLKLGISKATIYNINKEAFLKLEFFEAWAREKLLTSPFNHADETGINLNGKKIWLHTLTNDQVTLYHADLKRGTEAIERMGILQHYKGILCHDHWKSYYTYSFRHALCNAHHLRELSFAYQEDGQIWAKKMYKLLNKINDEVNTTKTGKLSKKRIKYYENRYRVILNKGKDECPVAEKIQGKRGRQKKSKSRNLLERLIDFENDTLRFMKESVVSFTNNQGENDLRMTKVQQKISGCFRSIEGAEIFCRIRAYLVTCRKNGVNPTEALRLLFAGDLPAFIV